MACGNVIVFSEISNAIPWPGAGANPQPHARRNRPPQARPTAGGAGARGCQYFLSMFAAYHPYAEGLQQFHEVFRADGRELLSVKRAFATVRAVTDWLERLRQQEISDHLQADAAPEVEDPIGGTVAVSIDAAKVPVRGNERVDEAGKKNWGPRLFNDAKLAVLGLVRRDAKPDEARCTNVSCVAASEHADKFFPRIEVELKRRCRPGTVKNLVILADGAGWISSTAIIVVTTTGTYVLNGYGLIPDYLPDAIP